MARKKYAASTEALADHRERSKNYRVYGRQTPIVMDGTSDIHPDTLYSCTYQQDQCAVCGVRRVHENLELLTIPSD